MDIQNHSINHPNFTTISSNEVIKQVSGCNQAIYQHLNGKISLHHAYPGGAHNSTVHQILRDLGVRTATTVAGRKATRSDDLLTLPRYSVTRTTSLGSFKNMVGFEVPPLEPLPYEFAGTVGSGWSQPSFGDRDAEGKLWICDYSGRVRVFLPDGSEADFSPITQGLKEDGTSLQIEAPSGVCVTPSGEVIVTIADYIGPTLHFGLFRYRASNGQALAGIDLDFRPGDIDCDASGLLYLLAKVIDEWHVYTPEFVEVSESPFGPGTENHIQRGISVLPDSSKVYVISETSNDVRFWEGSATTDGASYSKGYSSPLVDDLSGASGGVDVMDDGTVFVGYDDSGIVRAFDAGHNAMGDLAGGNPALDRPRGVVFTPDGRVLWVISRNGFIQRWERMESTGIPNWSIY